MRISHGHNHSDRTMALGPTQPLTAMSTSNISWGWRRPVCRDDNFTTLWEPHPPAPLRACPGVYRDGN